MFRLPAPCCKSCIYTPDSSPRLLGAVLTGLLELLHPGFEGLTILTE